METFLTLLFGIENWKQIYRLRMKYFFQRSINGISRSLSKDFFMYLIFNPFGNITQNSSK